MKRRGNAHFVATKYIAVTSHFRFLYTNNYQEKPQFFNQKKKYCQNEIGQKGYDFSQGNSILWHSITLLLRYFCSEFKYH